MESKNSFLLYTEQKEVINELSNEDAGELIKAIYAYAAGEEVNLRKDLYLVFIPIRQQIDRIHGVDDLSPLFFEGLHKKTK